MTDKLNAENLKNYLGEHGGYLTKKDLKSDLTRQTFGVLLRPKETITDFLYLYDLKSQLPQTKVQGLQFTIIALIINSSNDIFISPI